MVIYTREDKDLSPHHFPAGNLAWGDYTYSDHSHLLLPIPTWPTDVLVKAHRNPILVNKALQVGQHPHFIINDLYRSPDYHALVHGTV